MALNLDSALGIHPQALELRARRTEVLANNLANADTPNFKAKDLDFRAALAGASAGMEQLQTTSPLHLQASPAGALEAGELYVLPGQPSLDGNTVDPQQQKAQFAENAMQYEASLRFLNGKIASLRSAIRGE